MPRQLKNHFHSYKYATDGIIHTLKTQSNIWVQIPIALLVIFLAWYFHVSVTEWLVLVISICLVLVAELFNTAVEYIMNVVKQEHDLDVKTAKDIAAGAVFVTALSSVIVGLIVFYPKIF